MNDSKRDTHCAMMSSLAIWTCIFNFSDYAVGIRLPTVSSLADKYIVLFFNIFTGEFSGNTCVLYCKWGGWWWGCGWEASGGWGLFVFTPIDRDLIFLLFCVNVSAACMLGKCFLYADRFPFSGGPTHTKKYINRLPRTSYTAYFYIFIYETNSKLNKWIGNLL